MWKGILTVASGVAVLSALAMSNQFRALTEIGQAGLETGLLQSVPVSTDMPAFLSYTCRIADMISIGGFCGV